MAIDPVTGEIIITPADIKEHNVQSLIEISYVKTANDVLESQMSSLNNALTTTTNVINTLTGLQGLHNDLTVVGKSGFGYNYTTGSSTTYQSAAAAYFGTPVKTAFAFAEGSSEQIQFSSDIAKLKAQLSAEVAQLSATTPLLPSSQGGGVDPNSLLAKIKEVLQDLTKNDITTYAGQKAWVEDNYNALTGTTDSANAGAMQQNLTDAITAGQSLNSTQTQSVRNYLFVFEEYYKSASAVLQKISQMIEKMGQNISR